MVQIQTIETNALSTFHTRHRFLHYGEFTTVAEFLFFRNWAREHGCKLYILGNGSNTLFMTRTVRTLVLLNRLEPRLEFLDKYRAETSSSLHIRVLLEHCHKRHLDSFYYLASAPATVGGAIAMNAGRGRGYSMTIFDFLESVSYVEGESVVTVPADSIERHHRWTPFTGINDLLIVSAVFRFRPGDYEGNPIADRLAHARKVQDLSAPNCGSVFKECHGGLQRRLRGLHLGTACFSLKTTNWILNRGDSPWSIRALICTSKGFHWLLRKKVVLELIEVR
jgi:UDP-N-acetylmuramate dehydrogenase